jgi:hypothetical protein
MNRRGPSRFGIRALFLVVLAAAPACGNTHNGTKPSCSGDCSCTDVTCTCRTGGMCTFGPADPNAAAGATDAGPVTGAAPPDDVTYHCDSNNQCDLTCGSGCSNTCDGRSVCAGSCTSNCTSSCAGSSECTLTTGVNSNVTCAGGSACKVTLDPGSTITCAGDSTCMIDCPKGGCTAECGGSAGCSVACGGTAPCQIECNGMKAQDCAAGSTCNAACGRTPEHDGGSGPRADAGRR